MALARVLSRSGRWVVLHGAALLSGTDRRVAVIVEPAHPARITSLLMSANELTRREQDVTRLDQPEPAENAEMAAKYRCEIDFAATFPVVQRHGLSF